ncbi:condensin-2 complex subunit CAP-D3 [Aristolochia californica]|uniref:condensin-2 complex subunit CAP-D3 n=1 Tax=Aristolochia californica TaxID=171875 RepID=UPI0035D5C811
MEESLIRIVDQLESLRNSHDQSPISPSVLRQIHNLFEDGEESRLLFSEMAFRNRPHSSLVQSLAISMDSSNPTVSLSACDVYLSILICPSSPLYTFFTPLCFLSLLQSLRRCFKHHRSGPSPSFTFEASTKKNTRKRKGRAQDKAVGTYGEDSGTSQVNVRFLFNILEKLSVLLGRLHLNRFPESLKSLIETTAEILVMGIELCESASYFHKFSDLCFRLMQSVLNPYHGDQAVTAMEVLKSLSPAIILVRSQVRTLALRFVTGQVMTMAKDSTAIKKVTVYFPRFLIGKAPEKSDSRALAVESIMEIVKTMEFEDQVGFVEYVVKMTKGKAQLRLLAVDLIPMLLLSLPDPSGQGNSCWDLKCLEALISRCSDASAGVRARALSNMANVLEFLSDSPGKRVQLRDMLGSENVKLNDLLRRRCKDDKAAVRKATLHVIMKYTALMSSGVDEVMLKLIGVACSDPLVSIRKAALSALSEIFRKFSDSRVVTEWLQAVPRLITDSESGIQEECGNVFQELVLERVSRIGYTAPISNTDTTCITDPQRLEYELESIYPGVLTILKGICDGEVAPYVKKVCISIGKKNQLKRGVAIALQNIIRTSESLWVSNSMPMEKWTAPPGAWFLLSEVSSFLPKVVGWKFLEHHWKLLDKVTPALSPLAQEEMAMEEGSIESNSLGWAADRVFLLQTISNVSVELPPEPAADLAQNLLQRIEGFNMHSTEVGAHVKTLRTLCKRKAAISEKGDNLVVKCVDRLLSKALEILNHYVSEIAESGQNSFKTPPPCGGEKEKIKAKGSRSLSRAVTAVFTIGSLVLVCPSADLKGIIPVLHTIITSECSQPTPKEIARLAVSVKQVAHSLYVQSWLTMGKICLADGKLAKRYIPLFVQELEKSECAALRNNIVVVMTDFCVRYTALIDCYIPKITISLRDPCEIVRRQTFILLSRLLQRDYVKWRGILFLRFLVSLVDESVKIRQLADFLFGDILKAKAPLLAYNSFIEAIFFLNDCRAHSGHSEPKGAQNGRRLFSIRGNDEKSRSERMYIYVTLLKQMAPEHLLATSAKLCAEILAAASDGLLDISDITAQSVLQDALQILACKEMRIQSNRGSSSGDAGEMEVETGDGNGAIAAAKGRLVTQTAKKNLIQNAIPIFIELKRLLESRNSSLTGCLMECLRVLLKDYKNEIDDILVADPQLRKEIIYDMQKYEAAKTKFMAQQAAATVQRSTGHLTPTCGNATQAADPGNHNRGNATKAATKIASAVAEVAAEATARSVLKEVNRGIVTTPPLHSMSIPKLKSTGTGVSRGDRHSEVLESLRRRQSFDSDEEH